MKSSRKSFGIISKIKGAMFAVMVGIIALCLISCETSPEQEVSQKPETTTVHTESYTSGIDQMASYFAGNGEEVFEFNDQGNERISEQLFGIFCEYQVPIKAICIQNEYEEVLATIVEFVNESDVDLGGLYGPVRGNMMIHFNDGASGAEIERLTALFESCEISAPTASDEGLELPDASAVINIYKTEPESPVSPCVIVEDSSPDFDRIVDEYNTGFLVLGDGLPSGDQFDLDNYFLVQIFDGGDKIVRFYIDKNNYISVGLSPPDDSSMFRVSLTGEISYDYIESLWLAQYVEESVAGD